MYISVDSYEEMYLSNKDVGVIEREVEKMRSEISGLKTKMESPAYRYLSIPTDDGAIEIYRTYLERAMKVLSEKLGGVSVLTEEEKVANLIDSMTDDIVCLTLTVGRHFENKYELCIDSDSAKIIETHLGEASVSRDADRASLLSALYALHIGEWRSTYLPEQYGCTLSEPTKWQVRIDYKNGAAPRFYDGLGIFPYNFSSLCKLLGAEAY